MTAENGAEKAAGDFLAAAVHHPLLGVVSDTRIAYLAGVAEGIRLGWQSAGKRFAEEAEN